MNVEAKLQELGIVLPPPPKPVANYVPSVMTGNLLFLSGHGPVKDGKLAYVGKVGSQLTIEQGYEAARLTALNCLASAQAALGTLNRVRRVVKVTGFVNSAPGFTNQPQVINGTSDLLGELFGEAGRHARSAVGMAELPFGIAVEVEMVLEVE